MLSVDYSLLTRLSHPWSFTGFHCRQHDYHRQAPADLFAHCQKRYGNIFIFIVLDYKTIVYLDLDGDEFILNGKLRDVSADEVYGPLTTPVFGPDVVCDCPNWKVME